MAEFDGYHPLHPIVDAWLNKIRLAQDHKAPWQDIADQCQQFFAGATGFMWEANYQKKWLKGGEQGEVNPRFKITISKAFELVAIFGPTLYWRNPVRQANPREPVELPPELLAMKMGVTQEMVQQVQQGGQNGQPVDPTLQFRVQQFQQQLQQAQQANRQDTEVRKMRAELMERYLNWTPSQLRLHRHAELAITEALVKGRGVLWSEPYRPPGSKELMVGSFWETVDNLFIDPDAESIDDAWWIARRWTLPVWKAERKWGLKKGTLKEAGNLESLNSLGEREGDVIANNHRAMGQTQDLVTGFEVWSRCGVGGRLTEAGTKTIRLESSDLMEKLDRWCGDYCYLVVADGIPFPLNFSSPRLMSSNNEEVQKAFQWPTPHWRDGKWPCAVLDFYPSPRSVWPIPPMAPGLGELIAINVFMSHLTSRIWMSMRDFIAVLESAAEDVEKIIKEGKDLSFLHIKDGDHKNINEVVQFLQHPPTNMDAWKIVEALLEMFERRTGLSEILYAMQKKQERTATGSQIRQQNAQHRPDHMASKVEEWMTDVSLREALTVRWWLKGEDVRQLLGPVGAQLWEEFIVKSPVGRTVHDIDFRVEASSAKKPNLDKDLANIHEGLQMWGPILHAREQQTGDFGPLNWLMDKWGDKSQIDTSGMQSEPPPPQPDPAQQQAEQEAEIQQQQAQQGMQIQQAEHQQDQSQSQQDHGQDMQQTREKHVLDMQIKGRLATIQAAIAKKQPSRSNGSSK